MGELLNAIVERLNISFKNHRKYLFKIGGFERPSFFIYVISNKQTIINKSMYNQNIIVRILYLDSLDENNNTNNLRQTETLEEVLNLFSTTSIKVNNRHIKISESFLALTDDNEAYVQVTFDNNKAIIEDLSGYELMESIELETKGGI